MNRENHILVRGLNWLGDAVMGAAALQRLRQARPAAWIAILSPEKLADLWVGQPFVDEVVTFNAQQGLWATAKRLRALHCGVGVAFPNSVRSALELWLAGIPVRIGYARPWRTFFLSHPVKARVESIKMHKRSPAEIRRRIADGAPRPEIPVAAHHINDYLQLTSVLGASADPLPPRIQVGEEQLARVREKFGLGQARWLGLNPGAEYGPAKRWPAQRFVAAAIELHKRTGCHWLLFGGGSDRKTTEQISRDIERQIGRDKTKNLAGQTTLRELAAALKTCSVVLTNDTGPMHLASAVGTPVVVPFGSTSPEMTGPCFAANARILKSSASCAPCFRRVCPVDLRCLTEIEPQRVVEAAMELISG